MNTSFASHAETIARALLGDPNRKQSTHNTLRYGTNGSLAVEIKGEAAGTWYDHEVEAGGGMLDLIERELDLRGPDAVNWLRSIGIVDDPSPKPNGAAGKPDTAISYVYRDQHGNPLFRVLRAPPRKFWQERYDTNTSKFVKGVKGVALVPYRLPELLAAPTDAIVLVVEGEKDADNAARLGFTATTNAGGAEKWQDSYSQYLSGRDIVILPDNDEAGRKHAQQVTASVRPVAARVRILELPGLADKGDVSDWIAAGGTAEQLQALIEAAPNAGTQQQGAQSPPLIQAADFVAGYRPPEYEVDGLVQRSRCYSLTGPTGHGKTAIGLCLAVHKALGRSIHGREVSCGRVLYLAAESPDDVKARLILTANRMALNLDDLPLFFAEKPFSLDSDLSGLEANARKIGDICLLFVDTGAAFQAASGVTEENSNPQVLRFALSLRRLIELPGRPAVLALMHPIKHAKSQEDLLPRGGGAFLAEVDGNFTVWSEGDRALTELSWAGKLRGPSFEPLSFVMEKGTCARLVDAKGRQMPSVWAYPATAEKAEREESDRRRDEDQLLMTMAEAPDKSIATWAEILGWISATGQPAKSKLHRALQRLENASMVRKIRDQWRLTKAGQNEADRLMGRAKPASKPTRSRLPDDDS